MIPEHISWPPGITTEIFLRDYWQQKPLLIRAAFPDWHSPMDHNDLAGIALEADGCARLVFEPNDDNPDWQLERGPLEEHMLTSLPRQGWSLMVAEIEKLLPDFAPYFAPFQFLPNWRLDDLMISAAPNGASVGAHIDAYDVFLLQGAGEREWHINTQPDTVCLDGQPLAILREFVAEQSWVLQAGDMLYLPPGVAHHGIARGDASMTWSFGARAPNARELVQAYLDDHQEHSEVNPRYSDPGLTQQADPGELPSDAIDKLIALMRSALNDETRLRAWLGCFLTEPAPDSEPPAADLPDSLQLLHRRTDVKMLFIENQGSKDCTLYAGGLGFACRRSTARWLSQTLVLDGEALAQALRDPQDRHVISQLFANGWLETVDD